jgi:hypothetical protein
LRCCRTPNDAPEAFFLRSNRRIDQNYFRFKVSSRRIERRLIEDVGFRVLAAGNAPNFRTIADFRKLHLATLAGLFEEVLKIELEAGALKLGRGLGWHQGAGQCQQAQSDELRPDAGAATATARRSAGTAGPG